MSKSIISDHLLTSARTVMHYIGLLRSKPNHQRSILISQNAVVPALTSLTLSPRCRTCVQAEKDSPKDRPSDASATYILYVRVLYSLTRQVTPDCPVTHTTLLQCPFPPYWNGSIVSTLQYARRCQCSQK